MRKGIAMVLGVLGLSMVVGGLAAQGAPAPNQACIVTVEGTLGPRQPVRNWVIETWVPDDAAKTGQPRKAACTWVLKQGGTTYYLDLQDNPKLLARAITMMGKKVVVTGRVENWTIQREPKPDRDGRVITIGFVPQRVKVIVVVGLREVE